jgi:hypothetical protein
MPGRRPSFAPLGRVGNNPEPVHGLRDDGLRSAVASPVATIRGPFGACFGSHGPFAFRACLRAAFHWLVNNVVAPRAR